MKKVAKVVVLGMVLSSIAFLSGCARRCGEPCAAPCPTPCERVKQEWNCK